MHITQKEIANRLGVSRQLVTHALNGRGTISEEKRRQVLQIAEEMGYSRNELVRAVKTGKSRTIGLLIYGGDGENTAFAISGALDEAFAHNYTVKVFKVPFEKPETEMPEILQRCREWRIDGLVVYGLNEMGLQSLASEAHRYTEPIVYVEGALPEQQELLVYNNDYVGFKEAIEHLVGLGHKNIVHFSGRSANPLTMRRNVMFLDALRERGMPCGDDRIVAASWADVETIERVFEEIMSWPERPTAIVCAADSAAMTIVRAARTRGIIVPRDLSVVGFGNFQMARYCDPPLTTIAQDFPGLGKVAVQQLLCVLDGQTCTPLRTRFVESHLRIRESTSVPR